MTQSAALPPAFAPTSIPQVADVSGVYPVLQGTQAGNPLMGGWGYLQWTGEVYHEAYDLNSMGGGDSDLGALVVAPLGGVVSDVLWWNGVSTGFGNQLAMYVDDERAASRCYLHVAHLHDMVVIPGQRVAAGQQLGSCGKSGNQGYAHAHTALWHEVPPGGWGFWQVGYSREWVAGHTLDPGAWFWASVTRANELGAAPPPPEVIAVLEDWQIRLWCLAPLYDAAAVPFNPDSGTAQGWVDALRAGTYLGRPRTEEQPYGDGDDRGVWVEFEQGCLWYRIRDGQTSTTG